MKKLFVTMTMLAGLVSAPVFAADNSPLRIRIPYDFVVSGKTLPAGQYNISESFGSAVVFIRGANAATSAMVIGNSTEARNLEDTSLAFTVVDGKHYLVNVTHNGVSKDLRAPQSGGPVTLALLKTAR